MSRTTKNQHAFILAYLETGKPSESYKAAGYKCDRMSDGHIAEEAQRLLKNPHVARIIEQGRAEARERSQVTIKSLTDELEENRRGALKAVPCQAAAAVAATMAKAKLHGLADGEGAEPKGSTGPQPEAPSKWAAVRAEIDAARKEAEEERSEAGTGADGNGATGPTDTRH
jgi:phage terminase small subunit